MVEVTFQNPVYLWYLLSVPLLIATHFYFLRYSKHKGIKFANFQALKRISGEKLFTKNYSLLILRTVILLCLILAVAGTTIWYVGESSENDYVIALDVSASMTAQDIEPTRLDAAKQVAIEFLDRLKESSLRANIGLITFSGSTYIEELVTKDMGKVRDKLSEVEVRREGGTDIAGALVTGTNMLLSSEKGKSLILISDGSQTVSATEQNSMNNALRYALNQHIIIHTIGIGSEAGPLGYLPEFYNASAVFNEETLINLANSTNGKHQMANTQEEISKAFNAIAEESSEAKLDYELSYGLLLLAVFLIFIEWGLVNTKFRRLP